MRIGSSAREILHHRGFRDARFARGGRRVAAAADKRGMPAVIDGADRGDVAVPDRVKRVVLRAAIGRIQQHDVGGVASLQEAAVEP